MAIALLLISVLTGVVSAGTALYLDLGWVSVVAAYVFGGMIASGFIVAVSVATTAPRPARANVVPDSVSG